MAVHPQIRPSWLALSHEPILMPEQPILDAHHHLWDREESRYRTDDFLADVQQGHRVLGSLYVQCRNGYRTSGPQALRPLGEVETVAEWSAQSPNYPLGIVAFADLMLGSAVREVIEGLKETASKMTAANLICGIRNTTAYHPDPRVRSNPHPPPDGLLRADAFYKGALEVERAGLVLDIWAYQTQLQDVVRLARERPGLAIVVDHCGGPLGVGPYRHRTPDDVMAWRKGLYALAECPNTRLKVGGFGLAVFGYDYHLEAQPPHSERLALDWAPYIETCLNAFGPERIMLESNFPVDKGMFSYTALWNAFKRLTSSLGPDERDQLFWRTAADTYGIAFEKMISD